MPEEVKFLIKDAELGSSGAMVTSLTDDERFEAPYMVDGEVSQVWKSEELCAPFFSGCRYGPSLCAPRREAEFGTSRGAREGRIWWVSGGFGLKPSGSGQSQPTCWNSSGLTVGMVAQKPVTPWVA